MGPKHPSGEASGGPLKKRKTGPGPHNGSNNRFPDRRVQIREARKIPAQLPEAALKDGELNLQAFVAAHEFEIKSLEQSIATSKATGTSRAFQKVPRGLRRRTASHNPRRIPKRLRARAKREMVDDKTPLVEARRRKPRTTRARIRAETAKRLRAFAARKKRRKETEDAKSKTANVDNGKDDHEVDKGVVGRKPRPKIRRNLLNEPPSPPAKFRKRQLNKTWLPTHQWHAKRARMTEPSNPLWRFAMPLTPNEKIYRPVHRAQGDRGALVWDMSYVSTIGLYGNSVGIERVLKRIGVSEESCWNDKGRKWRAGTRSWQGFVSREARQIRRTIGPCTIVWNPATSVNGESGSGEKQDRQVSLRLHPSAFLETFDELLRLAKMETPQLYIEDLRYEIGSIELSGPASTEALHAVLTTYPSSDETKTKHAELFEAITGLSNPASLPANSVLGFEIQDPRLRYPPRKPKVAAESGNEMQLLETIAEWPAENNSKPYRIFDRDARHKASCLPSQALVNRRRRKITPGSFLKPGVYDPAMPILLLASRTGSGKQAQGTWTLLAPWKCILPLWYSIVHCPLSSGGNPRFAGLNEMRQVAFERGRPSFPMDFPCTDAGVEWEVDQRQLRKRAWGRRPKSKRTEWGSLGLGAGRKGEIGDGLACDFEYLLNLPKSREDASVDASNAEDKDIMDIDSKPAALKKKKGLNHSLQHLTLFSKANLRHSIKEDSSTDLPPYATINVRISLLGRGVVGSCARVYRLPSIPQPGPTSSDVEVPGTMRVLQETTSSLPSDLRSQWLARVPSTSVSNPSRKIKPAVVETGVSRHCASDAEVARRALIQQRLAAPPSTNPYPPLKPNLTTIDGCHSLVPDAEDLVGFVTSGEFSLAEGRGIAMGSLAVDKILKDVRGNASEGTLCIVRNAGENVGWLARWEVI